MSNSQKKDKISPEKLSGNVQLVCHCGTEYVARAVDLKRGYSFSCCKSCAAKKRDFGRRGPIIVGTNTIVKSPSKSKKQKRGPIKDKRYAERAKERQEREEQDKLTGDFYEYDLHPFSGEALGQWED